MDILSGLLSAFGLSGAAGLNAYVPLFLVGVLQHFEKIQLSESFAILGEPWLLGTIAVVGLFDFFGDKIPGVDHILHFVSGIINAAAGAILFAAQAGVAEVPPALNMALGVLVAGGVHATRTTVRPLATASTAGVANPVLSFLEDVLSVVLSVLAIFVPILALFGLVALMWMGYKLWTKKQDTRSKVPV